MARKKSVTKTARKKTTQKKKGTVKKKKRALASADGGGTVSSAEAWERYVAGNKAQWNERRQAASNSLRNEVEDGTYKAKTVNARLILSNENEPRVIIEYVITSLGPMRSRTVTTWDRFENEISIAVLANRFRALGFIGEDGEFPEDLAGCIEELKTNPMEGELRARTKNEYQNYTLLGDWQPA